MYHTLKCQCIRVIFFFFGLWLEGYQRLVLFDETISGLCNSCRVSCFLAIIAAWLFKQIVNIDSGGPL